MQRASNECTQRRHFAHANPTSRRRSGLPSIRPRRGRSVLVGGGARGHSLIANERRLAWRRQERSAGGPKLASRPWGGMAVALQIGGRAKLVSIRASAVPQRLGNLDRLIARERRFSARQEDRKRPHLMSLVTLMGRRGALPTSKTSVCYACLVRIRRNLRRLAETTAGTCPSEGWRVDTRLVRAVVRRWPLDLSFWPRREQTEGTTP
jgi:hypothetical protein